MKPILRGVGISIAAMFMAGAFVVAQTPEESITLTLQQQVFDLTIERGESRSETFKIINGSDQQVELYTNIRNFNVAGEEGGVELTEESTNFSVADWITVNPEEITLEPRGSISFNFTIDVPEAAEPGSHFGAIIVRSDSAQINPSGPSVAQEIGPIILVTVPGEVEESASIASFGSTRAVWTTGPVELETRIFNEGNVHFKPQGRIVIKNMFGSEVTTINLTEQNVLPDSIRRIIDEWDPGLFAFGRYTADLSLTYGQSSQQLSASTAFFVFPWLMTLIIVGSVVLIVLVIRGRHRLAEAGKALAGR